MSTILDFTPKLDAAQEERETWLAYTAAIDAMRRARDDADDKCRIWLAAYHRLHGTRAEDL